MQTDMHYYGTYAMARAAGLNPGAAQTIAIAAEYVDDSTAVEVRLADGSYIQSDATAHHPFNAANVMAIDQRRIWVPFHFIPANEGDSLEERLVCKKNSAIAREMIDHHLGLPSIGCNLELMGITAHVYADTFSHYGFSGISSDLNKVDPDSIKLDVKNPSVLSYIQSKAESFRDKYVTHAAVNAVALGHGSVSTFPDRPYLTWSFTYERTGQDSGQRANPVTFLEACELLHTMFSNFGEKIPDVFDSTHHRPFSSIEGTVQQILAVEGDMRVRVDAWQKAAAAGALYPDSDGAGIPVYNAKSFEADTVLLASHTSDTVSSTGGYAFMRAAKLHRDYVLGALLPKYNLYVLRPHLDT